MIRRLSLQNWRNYEDVAIDFKAGTTFVVAPNGVGKTSLVEAARWALFGAIGPDKHGVVRAGADAAEVTVELELPSNQILSVHRTIGAKSRRADMLPIVHLDGTRVPVEELGQQLTNAYGTELSFLARLTMPATEHELTDPSAIGLEDHLGRYYGIEGLRAAVNRLANLRKANDARIREIKKANSASADRILELEDLVNRASAKVAAATASHANLQNRIELARDGDRRAAALRKWEADRVAWTESARRLTERAARELDASVTDATLSTSLGDRLRELDQEIETARVQAAVAAAKKASLTANEERLAAADHDCPVCRRPLDDTTVAYAHDANQEEISLVDQSEQQFMVTERNLVARRDLIRNLQSEWDRIPRPGPQPAAVAATHESTTLMELKEMSEASLVTLVEARASQVQAVRALDEARAADEAMRELETLFAQEAFLRVAMEAARSTLGELLDDTIQPLAVEVDQRWKLLFPNRGDLSTYSSGRITRDVNGHALPFKSFSTGESMSTSILLRLLVSQMATTASFCWFDEPLEHLDPDVRRTVANLLSRVTRADGPLKQVVVTTYEEPLARHLHERDQEHVSLLDVRYAN